MIETENGVFMVDPSMVDILDIDQIKPYEKNAKKHDEEQVQQIINSIKAFGMNDPIGVWGKDNICVEGHGRLLALKQMGETKVPVIHLDNLTDEQRKAYALAHNKLTMNTGFDFSALESELDDLSDYFDMADFGFFDKSNQDFADALDLEDDPKPVYKDDDDKKLYHCPKCGFEFEAE